MITKDMFDEFWENGVIRVKNAFSNLEIKSVINSYEPFLQSSDHTYFFGSEDPSKRRYVNNVPTSQMYTCTNVWKASHLLSEFLKKSPCGRLAGQLYPGKSIKLLYDTLVVKEPNCDLDFMWHVDYPAWPIQPQEVLTVWIALDHVDKKAGGVSFLKGSHKHKVDFKQIPVPDAEEQMKTYPSISWDMEPGDATIHHARMIHGSPPNLSASPRRGLSVRWMCGEHRYQPAPGKSGFIKKLAEDREYPLKEGDLMAGPNFSLTPQ